MHSLPFTPRPTTDRGAYGTRRSAPRVGNVVIPSHAFGTTDDTPIILLQNAFFAVWHIPPLPRDFNIFGIVLSFLNFHPTFLSVLWKKYILAPGKPRLRARVLDGCTFILGHPVLYVNHSDLLSDPTLLSRRDLLSVNILRDIDVPDQVRTLSQGN